MTSGKAWARVVWVFGEKNIQVKGQGEETGK